MIESGKDYSFLLRAPGQLQALFESLHVTLKHPVLQLPSAEWVVQTLGQPDGRTRLVKGLEQRERLIQLMEDDPYRYGYEPHPPLCTRRCWDDARRLLDHYRMLLITTRNRNSKTEFAAKEVCKRLMLGGKIIWCLCQDNPTSIRAKGQQETIWKYLPAEIKALNGKRSDTFALNYGPKNKFTDNAFLIPGANGEISECRFMNYEQKIEIIEGGAIDFYWADELVPVDWLLTLNGRLIDRQGHGLATFTPVRGYNEAYGMVFQGSRVIEDQEFPLEKDKVHWQGLAPGRIPYIVEATDPRYAGMIFPPDANPYVSFEQLLREWERATYEVRMIRLAGIAKKKAGNRFPKFNAAVHIIPADKVPKGGTNFFCVDFQGRNWFMLWVRVIRIGDRLEHIVYREWPDQPTYGEWATRSDKPNGARGPAQNSLGLGYKGYRQIILSAEGWTLAQMEEEWRRIRDGVTESVPRGAELIAERRGDPRSGKAPVTTQETGTTCNFDELLKLGLEIVAAPGLAINEGVDKINDLLNYDEDAFREAGQLTPLNTPALRFSDACRNTIDCLALWTGQGSEKEQASKDPIDCLRYLALSNLDDYNRGAMVPEDFGSYGVQWGR